jgi:hypothetical protein
MWDMIVLPHSGFTNIVQENQAWEKENPSHSVLSIQENARLGNIETVAIWCVSVAGPPHFDKLSAAPG